MIIGINIPNQEQEDRRNQLNYLESKRIAIYAKMQSRDIQIQKTGIEQWDKMEVLIENVKKNKGNKDYLNLLYEKIQKLKIKEEQKERY